MGTRVGRIVKDFVFRSVVDTRVPVDLSFHKHRALCRVADVTDESLELEVLDGSVSDLKRGDTVHVFLHLQNNHHTFDATYLGPAPKGEAGPRILISHPESLYKNLQRKHERVRVPDGMEIYFLLRGKRVDLGFPRAQKTPPSTLRQAERAEQVPRLDGLVAGFRAETAGRFSTNRIVMFRERQPSGEDETLVAALGSILWLPTTEEGLPETEPLPDIPIITRADLRAYEKARGTVDDLVDARVAQFLVAKRARGIWAEATCPILHAEYVLGCVSISNTFPRQERINEEHIAYIWQFSQILSGALEHYRYIANGASDRRRYDAEIIDMSASGLLFQHPSEDLSMELLINNDIEINLVVEGRTMRVLARVRRKFTEPGQTYYGVQFAEIRPEDFGSIFRYLYGRPPVEEDETRWEGGAPPPRVDLFGDQS